jgi:hypothetical protein
MGELIWKPLKSNFVLRKDDLLLVLINFKSCQECDILLLNEKLLINFPKCYIKSYENVLWKARYIKVSTVTMLNYLHGYKRLCCQNLAYRQTEIKWSFFVEHLNSWFAGTHESHENWYTTNKNEITVLTLIYLAFHKTFS